VSLTTKQYLKKYDKHLKKFNATKALDEALQIKMRIKSPQTTVGVMQELIRRGNIQSALAGKDEKSLGNLIKFIQRYSYILKFSLYFSWFQIFLIAF
jgi:hypothetical protein